MKSRQDKIREIISNEKIYKQEQLVIRLLEEGYDITQATVSRDIKNLGIKKSDSGDDKGCYYIDNSTEKVPEHFYRVLKEGFISAEPAMNMLVVKTVPGMAMAVAAAMDAFHFTEVVGCIAGDDTIFVAAVDVASAKKLKKRLYTLV